MDRDYTIDDFKRKVRTLMVATSVAGRGLDVKDLVLVINYHCPNHLEDYVHRVGRTGRAGRKGTAYTFISPDEEEYSVDLVKALEAAKQVVPPELVSLSDGFKDKVRSALLVPFFLWNCADESCYLAGQTRRSEVSRQRLQGKRLHFRRDGAKRSAACDGSSETTV